ncbi:hypothetical protein LE190_16170 [Massilia oculi]|uniref:Sialate O-acetylesterase domain-containing protein n=1 Tax=Massilia hydrophila TaxID=3044279 RepID=A0ABS7YGI9_9BURK|nr:sialate O-acetylesterase [Massilia oculi]MCA1857450.1 hypothetical protein [Massilia oculi]
MTIKFSKSAGNQWLTVADNAALTLPNGDWTVGFVLQLDGDQSNINAEYIVSNAGFSVSGSLQIAYRTGASSSNPGRIVVYFGTTATVRLQGPAAITSGAHQVIVQRSGSNLSIKQCPILGAAPSDGSSVLSASATGPTTALDGAGLSIGNRQDLPADRLCDQSIGRVFAMAGTLTDLEIARLAYGEEITSLGKTPAWYVRMDDVSDLSDRGQNGLTFTKSGSPATSSTQPAYGYVPAGVTDAIDGNELPAERIYQRSGGAATIALSGTYAGTAPTAVEYQLYAADGVTVLHTWAAVTGATIGSGTWSGSVAIPQGGMYRIAYRRSGGAVSAVKANLFGVGDLIACFGSSSAERMFLSSSGTGFTPAANVRKFDGAWATFGTDGCAIPFANSLASQAGVPVGLLDYGEGGTLLADWLNTSGAQFTALKNGITAVGGKLAAAYLTVGSNDAATSTISSRASHRDNLRQLVANLRTYVGQASLPILLSGMNRRTSYTVGAATYATQANYLRMAENDLGDDASVYHVQTLDLLLSGDGIHLSSAGAGFPASAARAAYVLGAAIYSGSYRRGPKLAAINAQGTTITATLAHRGGTDFTPASGITGFTASDASGALTLSPVVRANATTITLTANREIVAPLTVQYLAGGAPAVGTPVFDNGATALPMAAETDLAASVVSYVSSDYQLAYAIEPNVALVSADYAIAYAVESLATLVAADYSLTYIIEPTVTTVAADLSISYVIEPSVTLVSCDYMISYSILAAAGGAYTRAPLGSTRSMTGWADVRSTNRQVGISAGLPVLLASAIAKARADGAGMDAEIELDVRGIAGEVEHQLQRALVEQTRCVTLDRFPDAIKLAMPPLLTVESVKYVDVDGVQQTLDPQDYLVDSVSEPGYVMPAPGRSWPTTADRANAVEVRYRCGYGPDHTAVPAPIQSYILGRLQAQHLPAEGRTAAYLEGLLDAYRVYG